MRIQWKQENQFEIQEKREEIQVQENQLCNEEEE